MKLLTTLIFLLLAVFSEAQRHDSLRYNNGYLHFDEYGKGEALILLTGGPGAGHLQLESVAKHLGNTHRVILLEQRGTGRSMPTPYDTSTVNLKNALADINLLIDKLKLGETHLVGHSWGAMLAMHYAANFPSRVRSLVLLNTGPFKLDQETSKTYSANRKARLSEAEVAQRDAIFQKVKSNTATKEEKLEYDKWELIPVLYERSSVDSLITIINKGGLNARTGSYLFGSLAKTKTDIIKALNAFDKPIHIICGRQDPGAFVSYELKILVPESALHWINESGHFPMFERPKEFFSTLEEVLN
jgi:proline iminopeptidase